jgi:DNA-binding response OmpR family regulator
MATILIVDDDEDLLALLGFAAVPGWEVAVASNGTAALRLLRRRRVDVLVTDLVMPGLDGDALVRSARRLGFDPPVVLMSSRDDVGEQAARIGVTCWMAKPFSIETFRRCVASALASCLPKPGLSAGGKSW